jgi:hypothetical protein
MNQKSSLRKILQFVSQALTANRTSAQLQRLNLMECDREKTLELELRAKLARCRKLAQEFPVGLTAANIRELEAEIRRQLQEFER